MSRRKSPVISEWAITIKAPRWSQALHSSRCFSTPEAAAFYASSLVERPELWSEVEHAALCRLIEAEAPEDLHVRVIPASATA